MVKIVGISGSLRKHSFNAGLLRAAADAVPDGCTLTIGSIKDIPLYNADFEETGTLTDDGVKKQLTKFMTGFADFVSRMK